MSTAAVSQALLASAALAKLFYLRSTSSIHGLYSVFPPWTFTYGVWAPPTVGVLFAWLNAYRAHTFDAKAT